MDDGRLDVSPQRVRRPDGRIAPLVAVAVVVAIAILSGFGLIVRPAPAPSMPRPSAGSPIASAPGSAADVPSGGPGIAFPTDPTLALPTFAETRMPDAPAVVTVSRSRRGEDGFIRTWYPAFGGLTAAVTLTQAFRDAGAATADPSPDGRRILIHDYGSPVGTREGDTIRIFGVDGQLVWNHAPIAFGSPAVWAPDGSAVVIADGDTWRILELGADSGVTERLAAAPGALPIAFSADGRSIYGISGASPAERGLRPTIRLDRESLATEAIATFPASGPARLDTSAGGAASLVDPAAGLVLAREPSLAIDDLAGNHRLSYLPSDLPIVLGAAWAPDGRVLVLARAERAGFPVELLALDASGRPAGPIVALHFAGAATLGPVAGGFALLGFDASEGSELVLVRLEDGATNALRLPAGEPGLAGGVGARLVFDAVP